VTVADGRTATLRRLRPSDAQALLAAIDEADPADLRRRFMGSTPPATFLLKRLADIDAQHHVGLGAFDGQRLVGVAQFDRGDDRPTAEVAIEIASDWQHTRLGTQMLLHLSDMARECGITRFTACFFADNLGIQHLIRDIDGRVRIHYEAGEGFAEIHLDRAPEPSLTTASGVTRQ